MTIEIYQDHDLIPVLLIQLNFYLGEECSNMSGQGEAQAGSGTRPVEEFALGEAEWHLYRFIESFLAAKRGTQSKCSVLESLNVSDLSFGKNMRKGGILVYIFAESPYVFTVNTTSN